MRYLARLFKFHWRLFKKHNKSMWKRRPVNSTGNPLPWYTYGAIEFLSDLKVKNVFEYGAGYSTHWWSKRAEKIYFVEHSEEWFNKLIPTFTSKVTGYIAPFVETTPYVNAIEIPEEKFDVICIDGIDRMRCAVVATKHLTEDGVIVLDNSDLHPVIVCFLEGEGFTEIPFTGIGPINEYEWTTSVFVKNLNLWKLAW